MEAIRSSETSVNPRSTHATSQKTTFFNEEASLNQAASSAYLLPTASNLHEAGI
jgi:hypothetical protein